jgi:hypothetical protein
LGNWDTIVDVIAATTSETIVEPDERGRVTLTKIPGASASRYVGRTLPDGSVLLTPVVLLTQRDVVALLDIARQPADRAPGRSISDVLRDAGVAPMDPAVAAERMRELNERRARTGQRSLADLTETELTALREGTAGLGVAAGGKRRPSAASRRRADNP